MWWLPGPSGDKEVSGQLGSLEADPPPGAASLLHGSMACFQGDAPGASGVWLWPGTLMARFPEACAPQSRGHRIAQGPWRAGWQHSPAWGGRAEMRTRLWGHVRAWALAGTWGLRGAW